MFCPPSVHGICNYFWIVEIFWVLFLFLFLLWIALLFFQYKKQNWIHFDSRLRFFCLFVSTNCHSLSFLKRVYASMHAVHPCVCVFLPNKKLADKILYGTETGFERNLLKENGQILNPIIIGLWMDPHPVLLILRWKVSSVEEHHIDFFLDSCLHFWTDLCKNEFPFVHMCWRRCW